MDNEHQERMELLSDLSIVVDLLAKTAAFANQPGTMQQFRAKLAEFRNELAQRFIEGHEHE